MSTSATEISRLGDDASNMVAESLGAISLDHQLKNRPDGPYLLFEVAKPHERFFRLIEAIAKELPENNPFKERMTIVARQRAPANRLDMPEAQLLRATISETLTIDRNSFEEDFFGRYTTSVTDLEHQIRTNANFIVYGRRGSGKSSLLAYAMHSMRRSGQPFAWIAMQTYAGRNDIHLELDVFEELLNQLQVFSRTKNDFKLAIDHIQSIRTLSDAEGYQAFIRFIPRVRKLIQDIGAPKREVTIFLDDLHVIASDAQPRVLSNLYSATRGNRAFLKASGIEQFSRPWDGAARQGLQPAQDAQILRLDYNLTMPHKSKSHIVGILDAQARYCGLPGIEYLTSDRALSRLVWVAAAVPRDALSMFSAAISKGLAKGEKRVSVTSINAAASESADAKIRDLQQDATGQEEELQEVLRRVVDFCVVDQRKNAFLVEIQNTNPLFQKIQKLIALRLVHVLHEGITPHSAGKRFMALMLDYGFYVGIRAARSVDLFQKEPATILAKDLRRLPVFELNV